MSFSLMLNPIFLSIILMTLLCLCRFNVLLSILFSALLAGLLSNLANISDFMSFFELLIQTMNVLISGMAANLKTALSYILLGAIAASIAKTNLMPLLIQIISKSIAHKKFLLLISLALLSCFSQNLVPIHITFIPILIPPLLSLFNALKIDRRAIACALSFGLTTPYMVLPLGFGLIFQGIIKDSLAAAGIEVALSEVSEAMLYASICMLVGLFLAVFVFYAKPRAYKELAIEKMNFENLKMRKKEWAVLAGLILTLILQILTLNLPLSGLLGFLLMIIAGGIEYKNIDTIFDEGLKLMGYIAFVMLVAAGFAEVLKQGEGINAFIETFLPFMQEYKILAIFLMLFIGLIITMGIGTSFGTIPIIAALFCPLCVELGFSIPALILLIGIAGALGDAGSFASETTLGISVGLNADKQHDHIKDTCVPTFICYNFSLLFIGTLLVAFL